jgi:small subunit ribosomal protein S20
MPTTKSAKKRLRQNIARRSRNRTVKSSVKTQVRKVREAVAAGDIQTAETEFREAAKKLDRAGAHRVIHANKASRTKSRLQQLIKKAKPPKIA